MTDAERAYDALKDGSVYFTPSILVRLEALPAGSDPDEYSTLIDEAGNYIEHNAENPDALTLWWALERAFLSKGETA